MLEEEWEMVLVQGLVEEWLVGLFYLVQRYEQCESELLLQKLDEVLNEQSDDSIILKQEQSHWEFEIHSLLQYLFAGW